MNITEYRKTNNVGAWALAKEIALIHNWASEECEEAWQDAKGYTDSLDLKLTAIREKEKNQIWESVDWFINKRGLPVCWAALGLRRACWSKKAAINLAMKIANYYPNY